MTPPQRSEIHPGLRVQIVEKQNQRTGALSAGVVARILTKSPTHPHGIKVMLEDGKVDGYRLSWGIEPKPRPQFEPGGTGSSHAVSLTVNSAEC